MSICTFIASAYPLPAVALLQEYSLEINIDEGAIYDSDTDDNFFLHIFDDVQSYTSKKYGVWLEWRYTEGRAKQIFKYIKNALCNTDSVELWHVWSMDYCEYEDSPVINNCTISIGELTIDHIKEIDNAEIWNTPDKKHPDRPSFYCLTITR